ncbi:tetratricopeptide repeat-containing glycosyltransferase [[Mycobacterium] crassicus]|uniref:Glycosyltransferase n=1 Tax=[Mycobacterium] crassicus TaxID=2872309 RepID=A0ABU5XIY5_9MYCO|nr:glycosyltransferase [Mycolicibacter sp. MYC098]MEB3022253.1 glycosyltransferase [Mycolicibacter sp. MYC098]
MSEPVPAPPAICLNMIVRNEAHIITEALDSVAPYIHSWVIVDTGSDDGTQDLIREHMAGLGIPGEIHERPWRNFGHNRSEALQLARGHGDYIWVMDADDLLVGTPDLTELTAGLYYLRLRQGGSMVYWRGMLFRDGLPWFYKGVVHEYPWCDQPHDNARLDGDYHVESRRIGARNLDERKYARDRDLLLAEVANNPGDPRSVFYLAQSYRDLGDLPNARRWYARRAAMTGFDQETYVAQHQLAQMMSKLGEPWPEVEEAYLQAWQLRPNRAEPLYAIAQHYRNENRYQLDYLFAERAAALPLNSETLFVQEDVYTWRATDELAICASRLGRHPEAFALFRRVLALPDIPDEERPRLVRNRDFSVPTMLAASSSYPESVARGLTAGPPDAEVTVSVTAGPDRTGVEQTLNSFLHCCTDLNRAGRFLVVDTGLSAADRAWLGRHYGFVEFVEPAPTRDPAALLGQIRTRIGGRRWLHLGRGWQFFAPEDYLTRLTAVLDAEPEVVQVGVNFGDATGLTGTCATGEAVRRAPGAGRYVLAEKLATGPAMFDTGRWDRTGGSTGTGLPTATLDEVLCTSTG